MTTQESQPGDEPKILKSWQRFNFPYLYAARVEYDELVDEITLRVIQPGQVVENHENSKFIVFTVQQPFKNTLKGKK